MAAMVAEAMLYGPWKNFEELEENMTIEEVRLLLKAAYDREFRQHRMNAALKGIQLDEPDTETEKKEETVEERFERIQARAQAILAGKTEDDLVRESEASEYSEMGFSLGKE